MDFRCIAVNYHDFTQSLVDVLKMELKRNEVVVAESAEKELNVMITKVAMFFDAVNFRAQITPHVQYKDGFAPGFWKNLRGEGKISNTNSASDYVIGIFGEKSLHSTLD